jgi:hypothetical protein
VANDSLLEASSLTVSFLSAASWLPRASSDPKRQAVTIAAAAEQCGQ